MTSPWLFTLAVLTILATPGPTNTLLAAGAAMAGFRRSLMLLTAELGGYLITVGLAGFLLRPVIAAYPAIGVTLKLAVSLYLVHAALRLWRRAGNREVRHNAVTWSTVFVTTLLNPKGLILALAIVPFGHAEVAPYLAGFAVLVPAIGALWLVAGRLVGAAAGSRRHLVPRLSAVALAGFAGFIAASALG